MALHTFKVLCKHSLIKLCFRDPVQQPLLQGTQSWSPAAELCLLAHVGCQGLLIELETAPAGKVQFPILGSTKSCFSDSRGDVKQQKPAGMDSREKTNDDD